MDSVVDFLMGDFKQKLLFCWVIDPPILKKKNHYFFYALDMVHSTILLLVLRPIKA